MGVRSGSKYGNTHRHHVANLSGLADKERNKRCRPMTKYCVAATTIIGTHVENWEGENLGNITEVMIDKQDGEVSYLVLSYPGDYSRRWPNKRFAVPFTSIAMKQVPGDKVEYILNVQQDFLELCPGFDMNDWPDFADSKFITDLKDYYKDVSVDIRV